MQRDILKLQKDLHKANEHILGICGDMQYTHEHARSLAHAVSSLPRNIRGHLGTDIRLNKSDINRLDQSIHRGFRASDSRFKKIESLVKSYIRYRNVIRKVFRCHGDKKVRRGQQPLSRRNISPDRKLGKSGFQRSLVSRRKRRLRSLRTLRHGFWRLMGISKFEAWP